MALTKAKASNILLTTPAASSNDVTPATTEYVTTALANMVDSAPSTLNTLNELAAALGDDANFSTTVTNSIATKLPLAGGTMTGNLNLQADGLEIFLKSADYNIARIIPRGSSGSNLDKGLLSLFDAGTEDIRIDTGGNSWINSGNNLGIGTTSPSQTLHVAGNAFVSGSTYLGDSSADITYIQGKVGIGASSPGASLHVAHGSDTSDLAQFSGGHTGRYLAIRSFQNNSLDGAGFIFNASSSGGAFKFQTATTDRVIIDKDGNVGIGDTSPSAIRLSVVTPTANHVGLQVENSNTADSFGMIVKGGNDSNDYAADFRKRDNTSIMRIVGDGTVGIGTGAPNGELEVNNTNSGGLGGRIVIRNGSSTSGSYCRLYLSPTANDPETRGTLIQAENVDGNNNMAMVFKVSAGDSPAEHMRITSTGKVGIGKTDPNYPLVVAGTNPKIQIYDSDGNGQTNLYFGDSGSNLAGYIIYQHSDDKMRLGTNATDRITIDSTGRVNIGATASTGQAGTIFPQGYRGRQGVGGTEKNTFNLAFQASGATQLWIDYTNIGNLTVSSDYRIKRNIETQTADALTRVKQIRPVTYQRAKYQELFEQGDEVKEGFIAHELAEIIPSAVEGEKDSSNQIQSLNLDALCSVLTKAIQEQQVIIDDLKARIETLEG